LRGPNEPAVIPRARQAYIAILLSFMVTDCAASFTSNGRSQADSKELVRNKAGNGKLSFG
jgi:hypothetical protein